MLISMFLFFAIYGGALYKEVFFLPKNAKLRIPKLRTEPLSEYFANRLIPRKLKIPLVFDKTRQKFIILLIII